VQQNFRFYIGDVMNSGCVLNICRSLDDKNPIILYKSPENTCKPYLIASLIQIAIRQTPAPIFNKRNVARFFIDNFGFYQASNNTRLRIVYEYKLVLVSDMYWALLIRKHLKNGSVKNFPSFVIGKVSQEELERLKGL